ncbi:MAG: NHL repeat-containing protein [Thaumarchaeota archaeon]|nr:NHL repeat-containing protein [Nitrososphaerota archaeon]
MLGDPSLTAFNPGATPTGLVGPFALAFDSSGNLWVADSDANRILEYAAPFSTGEAASLVIGQSSLTSLASGTTSTSLDVPNGIAFDSGGNLWVVDSFNNRVLEYKAPLSTGEAASLVIGQPNFTSSVAATTATGLNSPQGIAFDSSGNLWIADLQNGRVLEYNTPFSTNEAASLVIGEANFVTANDEVSLKGLNAPNSVAFDYSGNLWVVDGHRVLEYTTPFSTHEAASLVIGQNTFTNSSTVTTSTGVNYPDALAFDSGHNLWVSDTDNNRVMEYTAPFSKGEAASLVIGQPNFTSSAMTPIFSPTATSLNHPQGLVFDSSGNLWVSDWAAGRVLEYSASSVATTSSPTSSTSAVSSSSSTTSSSVPSSSSASSSSSSAPASSALSSTTSSTSGGGGGVPVYPYQFAVATIFTVLLVVSYLLVRGRITSRGHGNQEVPSGV